MGGGGRRTGIPFEETPLTAQEVNDISQAKVVTSQLAALNKEMGDTTAIEWICYANHGSQRWGCRGLPYPACPPSECELAKGTCPKHALDKNKSSGQFEGEARDNTEDGAGSFEP